MRPNMDVEIVVLQSILANAKEQHQFKAGLSHAVTLLEESVGYAVELRTLGREVVRAFDRHRLNIGKGLQASIESGRAWERAIKALDAALSKNTVEPGTYKGHKANCGMLVPGGGLQCTCSMEPWADDPTCPRHHPQAVLGVGNPDALRDAAIEVLDSASVAIADGLRMVPSFVLARLRKALHDTPAVHSQGNQHG